MHRYYKYLARAAATMHACRDVYIAVLQTEPSTYNPVPNSMINTGSYSQTFGSCMQPNFVKMGYKLYHLQARSRDHIAHPRNSLDISFVLQSSKRHYQVIRPNNISYRPYRYSILHLPRYQSPQKLTRELQKLSTSAVTVHPAPRLYRASMVRRAPAWQRAQPGHTTGCESGPSG
jgi:hypothetical protein